MRTKQKYLYIEATVSICPRCMERVSAKIVEKDGAIFLIKDCPRHGTQWEILEEDASYFHKKRLYDQPGTPCHVQTKTRRGCPWDCGLCPAHEQHTCIGLIEITNKCNLRCPTCYAHSGKGTFLDLKTIERMMDAYIRSEFEPPEILQISGGEPTLHPRIFEILSMAKKKKFKYVMLNTNGLKLAEDEDFSKKLKAIFDGVGFEVYLQFDGVSKGAYRKLRGADLGKIKQQALHHLLAQKIPVTLAMTVQRGMNDQEVGNVLKLGLKTDGIRGINFQPTGFFGRIPRSPNTTNRMTMTGILRAIEKQSRGAVRVDDFIPLPCNVDRVSLTYLCKRNNRWIPLPRLTDMRRLASSAKNTFAFMLDDMPDISNGNLCKCLSSSCCSKPTETKRDFLNQNLFRISVSSFVDVYNFDIKSLQKECVHVITPSLKKIPFSAYNMFHRNV